MKLLKIFSIAIILLLLMSQAASAQEPGSRTPDYDAVKDFSITSNPNGVWSYGWTAALGGPFNLYTVADTNCWPGISVWTHGSCSGEIEPAIAHNDTPEEKCFYTWCLPPTYLYLHPGPTGELSVLRWTAPSSGKFMIQGAFEGLDNNHPTTTDVHVLVNSTKAMISGPITSYRLPLKFQLKLRLSSGDTVDFVVGYGKDGDYGGDATGVQFKVTRLGAEDAALPLSQTASSQEYPTSEYNALEDFSIASNPNGAWSYGWVNSLGDPLTLYTVAENTCDPGMSGWIRLSPCDSSSLPGIFHNDTGERLCLYTWCLPPTYLLMHPGPDGQLSVLRWTAPSTGMFLIEGEFTGVDYAYPTTTDVHVLVNSTKSLLSGPINSYRLPLTFQMKLFVASGDAVDFAIGYGYNGAFWGDATGVRFAVKRLGP